MMMQNILNARVARHPPDVLIKPDISDFRILEFYRARAILKASEAFIDDAKRDIEAAIQRFEHAPVSADPEKRPEQIRRFARAEWRRRPPAHGDRSAD
ncbi:MAG: hypothetical protein H6883_01885 [Rhodobiaceae bacterium]|nr:hypothetical protein [Rhodobiaceae bacterium]